MSAAQTATAVIARAVDVSTALHPRPARAARCAAAVGVEPVASGSTYAVACATYEPMRRAGASGALVAHDCGHVARDVPSAIRYRRKNRWVSGRYSGWSLEVELVA